MSTEIRVVNNFLKGFDKIISKDQLRLVMCGVYFEAGKAIATDAHKVIKCDVNIYSFVHPDSVAPETKEPINVLDGFFMDIEILKELKITKDKFITLSEGAINIHRSNGATLKTLKLQKMSEIGNYPKTSSFFDDTISEKPYFNFNGQYLLDIQNVFLNTGFSSAIGQGLKMSYGQHNRISIKNHDKTFEAVLMELSIN